MGRDLLIRKTTHEVVYKIKTLEEAHRLSVLISNDTPNPTETLIISELMFNAIEHGNLGITFQEKVTLVEQDIFLDEVNRRLSLPEYMHKHAEVSVKHLHDTITVCIVDMGNGFNFKQYLLIDETRIFSHSGRGIALANSILNIKYNDKGNHVCVILPKN